MKLNVKALAFASAILWGGTVFLVALINRFAPDYGLGFIRVVSSISMPSKSLEEKAVLWSLVILI